jgi:phage terminase small subunit
MTILSNCRHEAFARAIVEGKSAVAAYVAAGYKASSAEGNAARLMENEGVSARIAELKEAAAQGAVMQAREALERLSAIARCEDDDQLGAILRALELIGKHHKLFTDKFEHGGKDGRPIEGRITVEFVDPPKRKK